MQHSYKYYIKQGGIYMPRVFLKAREPFSSYSHFIGAVLSGIGLFAMLLRMLTTDTANGQISASVIIFVFPSSDCILPAAYTIIPAGMNQSCASSKNLTTA